MRIGPEGIALIQHFESCRLHAYPDPKTGAAPWTIGWGHTGPDVHPDTAWTQTQADAVLAADLVPVEAAVTAAVKTAITQRQFDALCSIVFNVGQGGSARDGILRLESGQPSTLLRCVNSGDFAGAADQFLLWISKGSPAEHGLTRRRTAERALFLGQCVETAIRAGDAA